jgi:hypothetical protein
LVARAFGPAWASGQPVLPLSVLREQTLWVQCHAFRIRTIPSERSPSANSVELAGSVKPDSDCMGLHSGGAVLQAALSLPHELMPRASAKPTSGRNMGMSAPRRTNCNARVTRAILAPCRSSVPRVCHAPCRLAVPAARRAAAGLRGIHATRTLRAPRRSVASRLLISAAAVGDATSARLNTADPTRVCASPRGARTQELIFDVPVPRDYGNTSMSAEHREVGSSLFAPLYDQRPV